MQRENLFLPLNKQQAETRVLPRNSSAHSRRAVTRTTPTAAEPPPTGDSVNGGTICAEEDVFINMAEAQTGRKLRGTFTDDSVPFHVWGTGDTCSPSGSLKKAGLSSRQESSNREGMKGTKEMVTIEITNSFSLF